jgi:tetratricopeptide (TPR) repeat protein
MGQLYQSMGQTDKAMEYYARNIQANPKTPSAYTSTLNLARCYMAQGPAGFAKAEATLLSLVQDNREILPEANEFRASLFALGELYYQNQRWSDAILRLEECLTRYPQDKLAPRAKFMLAESYRHSAQEIGAALAQDAAMEHRDALEKARQERLRRAAGLFEQVISLLDRDPGEPKVPEPPDEQYLRKAYMDRGECRYELGEYAAAIKLYDQAAARFAQDVTAVEAYVQIINAYRALNQPAQASAAAERARWVLKRIPDAQFGPGAGGALALSRQYYEDFLTLAKGP